MSDHATFQKQHSLVGSRNYRLPRVVTKPRQPAIAHIPCLLYNSLPTLKVHNSLPTRMAPSASPAASRRPSGLNRTLSTSFVHVLTNKTHAASDTGSNTFLCKEQHRPKRRYERGQIMTFVYYREKTVTYLAHQNS